MKICITGSVATGKTVISKELAKKLNLEYVDVNKLVKENKLYENYNKKLDTYEVDIKRLNKFLIKLIKRKKNFILDSHLSHYLSAEYVNYCVVCKCELKELKNRLEARGYSKGKVRENLDAEIFDTCLVEALENKHKIIVVDTAKRDINSCINELIRRLK